ncbi:MAG: hypothetical protein JJE04_17855 [Acidobacteriia bacterium]|nr:hypothetical protein [Terriglobia bacterium]
MPSPLDTRDKILNWSGQLALPPGAACVTGGFDPLTAAHVDHLERIASVNPVGLTVIITDPVDAILPSLARAQLVAGLRSVHRVILAGDHLEEICAQVPDGALHRKEVVEEAIRQDLVRHVHNRHNGA